MKPLLTLLLSAFLSASLQAETIKAAYGDWPPFYDASKKNGVALDITKAAFKSQGYKLELFVVPWARVNNGVKEQQYDVTLGAWWTEERTKIYDYSEPFLDNAIKFIKRKGDDFEYTDLNSLKGKSVGVVRGYGYESEFLKANSFKRPESNSLVANVRKLVNNRIDLTLEDEIVARATISKQDATLLKKIEFTENALTVNRLHVAAAKKNPRAKTIIAAFNKGLAQIKADGTFDNILAEYKLK
jgi:polar amino acid transport system substrate-binding protein